MSCATDEGVGRSFFYDVAISPRSCVQASYIPLQQFAATYACLLTTSIPVDNAGRRQVIVYAPHAAAQRWIDEELFDEPCDVRLMESVGAAVEMLVVPDGSRKVLVVDVDILDADELVALEGAWGFGAPLVGLGHVPREMRDALHITYVVPRPLGSEKLRAIICALSDGWDAVAACTIEPAIQPQVARAAESPNAW